MTYEKYGFFFLKSGSSNLSVDKTKSMVALRTSVFVSVSNKVQPYKKESVDSNILQSILFEVLRRVCLLSLNIGQWRRKWEFNSILF